MEAASAMPVQRRKPTITYGKTVARTRNLEVDSATGGKETAQHTLPHAKRTTHVKGVFDVLSSDEEKPHNARLRIERGKTEAVAVKTHKREVVKRVEPDKKSGTAAQTTDIFRVSPSDSERRDEARSSKTIVHKRKVISRPGPEQETKSSTRTADVYDVPSSDDNQSPPTRAAARSSRTQVSKTNNSTAQLAQKATVPTPPSSDTSTTRKRKRPAQQSIVTDVELNHPPATDSMSCEVVRKSAEGGEPILRTTQRETPHEPPQGTRSQVAQEFVATTEVKKVRRTAPVLHSGRRPLLKDISAPVLLSDMIETPQEKVVHTGRSSQTFMATLETELVDSVSVMSPTLSSASPAVANGGTLTSGQARLWSQLLPSDPITDGNSNPVEPQSLQLGTQQKICTYPKSPRGSLQRSVSDLPQIRTQRPRLVDRLKEVKSPTSDGEDDESISMEDLASSSPQKPAFRTEQHTSAATANENNSQQTSQSQTGTSQGVKVTYARTRSYLPEQDLDAELLFDLPLVAPERAPAASRRIRQPPPLAKKDSTFDMSDDDDAAPKGMRSIHTLRAAGRHSRFLDETQSLLNDVQDRAASRKTERRRALVELATKLADKSFVTRFVAQGFEHQLATQFVSASDIVADFALSAAAAFILAVDVPEHTVKYLYQAGAIGFLLCPRLHADRDITHIARDRETNISKSAQKTVSHLVDVVKKSSLWSDSPDALSPNLMSLKTLDLLVHKSRQYGVTNELLDNEATLKVFKDVGGATACPLSTTPSSAQAMTMELAISVLEYESGFAMQTGQTAAWDTTAVLLLAASLPSIMNSSPGEHTRILALRLALNLTNNNLAHSDCFASDDKTIPALLNCISSDFQDMASDADEDSRASRLNRLILALGLLINLAEVSDKVRVCTTHSGKLQLQDLVITFVAGQEKAAEADSMEESVTNVALGYLAVLLGNLCQNEGVRAFIRDRLPDRKLGLLVSAVEEFIQFHQTVDKHAAFEGEEGREVWSTFTDRLSAVVEKIRDVD
ncbi:hypothetical protein LTR50_004594 [Elasticomyces elasticus]|nr:hypothetical protein LTR50_004594 [Elasticomyces elasticus]